MKSEAPNLVLSHFDRFVFVTVIPVGLSFVLSIFLIGTLHTGDPAGPNTNPMSSFVYLGVVSMCAAMTVGGLAFCLIISSLEWKSRTAALFAGFGGLITGLLCSPIALFVISAIQA